MRRMFCLVVRVMNWKEGKDLNPGRNIVFRGSGAGLDETNEKGKNEKRHHNFLSLSLRDRWGH